MKPLSNYLRKALTGIVLCCLATSAWAQQSLPYWQDIQTTSVNKEPARTAFMTYENRAQALTQDYSQSPYYLLQSLGIQNSMLDMYVLMNFQLEIIFIFLVHTQKIQS